MTDSCILTPEAGERERERERERVRELEEDSGHVSESRDRTRGSDSGTLQSVSMETHSWISHVSDSKLEFFPLKFNSIDSFHDENKINRFSALTDYHREFSFSFVRASCSRNKHFNLIFLCLINKEKCVVSCLLVTQMLFS